jgi:SET domain
MDDNYRPKVATKRGSSGLGLFAGENIPKGQLIIEYTGERISDDEANERGGQYLFIVTDEIVIDGKGRENQMPKLNMMKKTIEFTFAQRKISGWMRKLPTTTAKHFLIRSLNLKGVSVAAAKPR